MTIVKIKVDFQPGVYGSSYTNSCFSENVQQVGEIAKKHNLGLHIDGARFFNAVTALKEDPARVAQAADSLTFCLSKVIHLHNYIGFGPNTAILIFSLQHQQ